MQSWPKVAKASGPSSCLPTLIALIIFWRMLSLCEETCQRFSCDGQTCIRVGQLTSRGACSSILFRQCMSASRTLRRRARVRELTFSDYEQEWEEDYSPGECSKLVTNEDS